MKLNIVRQRKEGHLSPAQGGTGSFLREATTAVSSPGTGKDQTKQRVLSAKQQEAAQENTRSGCFIHIQVLLSQRRNHTNHTNCRGQKLRQPWKNLYTKCTTTVKVCLCSRH